MSTVYVITGVSKGIGFELVKQLSQEPKNTVIGLVRDKTGTDKKVAAELGKRPNLHIVRGDLESYESLKEAAAETESILGNDKGVDYLVANAAYMVDEEAYVGIDHFRDRPSDIDRLAHKSNQTNVVGNIHLFQLFLPLVQKSSTKKVIAISTGMADLDLINEIDITYGAMYSASKAALNIIVAKFAAQYKNEGVLFFSMSPGLVDTGKTDGIPPEAQEALGKFAQGLLTYAPDFRGPITPEQSVKHMKDVWTKASVQDGWSGKFVSHYGNKKWV
ncbi:hypothetical protein QBC37DRAFT_434997 [Rhypophila decipiens]|uniref:Uncharacterized protein n=1 Tax=Rhypophila decipiens TaxID=261697 RepID=A0AAN7B314_9PEZI|nr:hypothetical protein QBC37DRAFT_434997 [Rhypophila decipiens]